MSYEIAKHAVLYVTFEDNEDFNKLAWSVSPWSRGGNSFSMASSTLLEEFEQMDKDDHAYPVLQEIMEDKELLLFDGDIIFQI